MESANKAHLQARQAIEAGDYPRAAAILAKANADRDNRSLDNLVLQARVLAAQHDVAAAVTALETAESIARNNADKARLLNMLADLLCSRPEASADDTARAIACLEKSLSLQAGPASAIIRRNLCALYYRREDYEAVHRNALALARFPEFRAKASLWLANSVLFLEKKQNGEQYLSVAADGAADLDDADLAWVIETALNYRAYELAQRTIDAAVSAGRGNFVIDSYQARLYYENKDYRRALDILTDELVRQYAKNDEATQFVFFTRGRSLDAIGQYDAAHESYTLMNQVAERSYTGNVGRDYVAAYRTLDLTTLPVYPLPDSAPCEPAFMVGFPRSGTTLLDSILDTQEQITTLSEIMGIPSAWLDLEQSGRLFPEELGTLSAKEVTRLRDIYFSYIRPYTERQKASMLVIDKLPLNIIQMPFIRMLFPRARFIVSLRHPLDVCLSCFQQGFKLNDEMRHFTRLESTFARYRDVMGLFRQYQDSGQFDILTVRYEDLVERFEPTAREVFGYLGIEPTADYLNFHQINRQKFSATPSRDQVTEPLYRSSQQRWRNYAKFIEPHIDTVRPFLDAFGYEA